MACYNLSVPPPEAYTLKGLIDHYNKYFRHQVDDIYKLNSIREFLCGKPPREDADGNPVIYNTKGNYWKDVHQRHLTNSQVDNATAILQRLKDKGTDYFKDFEEMVDYVCALKKSYPRDIYNINELGIYDFSLRFGKNANKPESFEFPAEGPVTPTWKVLLPEKYVYLQCGAADGVEVLHRAGYIALPKKYWRVCIDIFPEELQALGAVHLENFLCDEYKSGYLNKIKTTNNNQS